MTWLLLAKVLATVFGWALVGAFACYAEWHRRRQMVPDAAALALLALFGAAVSAAVCSLMWG